MYVKNRCLVTITTPSGTNIKFNAVASVTIDKSIDSVTSSAVIRIPASAALVYKDGTKTESVQTARQFQRGDKVSIQLGYDDRLNEEFEGFIYRINFTSPVEIECEGYEFLLRENLPTKTFPSTNLSSVLQYVVNSAAKFRGSGISIAADIPAVEMVNYVIPANLNGIDALQQIKEHYGLTIYFRNNTLYAGLDFIRLLGDVKYSLGINTPRADELKYQLADDVKLKIKAIQINKNNTKLEAEVGDPKGEQRTLYFYTAKSIADLKKLAEVEMVKYKFTGYTGKITTLLEPYAEPGMVAIITDIKYAERGGSYEIRGVNTTFGSSGASRSVDIGKTVSNG